MAGEQDTLAVSECQLANRVGTIRQHRLEIDVLKTEFFHCRRQKIGQRPFLAENRGDSRDLPAQLDGEIEVH